jgi:DNA invertase Pin-like site-specific DNA recombinase
VVEQIEKEIFIMSTNNSRITYLYARLSRDDGNDISNSIINQQNILTDYAIRNNFSNVQFLADDGFSGKDFERPAIIRILEDCESGKVGTLIVKDLSRFSRNRLEGGMLREIKLPALGVRFIAIQDNVDSACENDDGDDLSASLKDMFNEYYSKNTSKKVRKVKEAKAKRGELVGSIPPYGYRKTTDRKNLEPDTESAEIVKRIFNMYDANISKRKIAMTLTDEKLLTPQAYKAEKGIANRDVQEIPYLWNDTTISKILNNKVYIGTLENLKTTTGYRDHSSKKRTDVLSFENHHQPIIDIEQWNRIQQLLIKNQGHKNRSVKSDYKPPLAKKLYCEDCGKPLKFAKANFSNGHKTNRFVCYTYSNKNTKFCTQHKTNEDSINEIVLDNINSLLSFIKEHKKIFSDYLYKKADSESTAKIKSDKAALDKCKKRIAELDKIITSLYEDKALGKISEERYTAIYDKSEQEQAKLKLQSNALEQTLQQTNEQETNAETFITIVNRYANLEQLTPEITNALIDKVIVGETITDEQGNKSQSIEILYNGIGSIDFSNLI